MLQPIILEARGDSVDMCWVDGSMLAAFCAPSITDPRASEQCSQLAHSYIMKTIFALLDSGLMQEDDIWEPYSAQVGLDWLPLGLAGGDLANVAGGLSPSQCPGLHGAPGTNAMTLMHWFGNRDTAFLRQFRIVHRVSSDGQNIRIALAVGRVDNREYISRAVDGHITLFYGNERLLPVLNQVLQKLRERVETWGDFLSFKGAANFEYATEWYAWLDILVQSPLHAALHSLVAAAVGDGRAYRIWLKQVLLQSASGPGFAILGVSTNLHTTHVKSKRQCSVS